METTADVGFAEDRWSAIIECESGGDSTAQNLSSTASGLYQFIDETWRLYGGSTRHAKDASVAEQHAVAERAFAAEGYRPWTASRSCWESKVGKHTSGNEAPKHAVPQSATRHAAGDGTHTVKRGDTLNKIAARHHTSVAAIVAANPSIHDPDRIFPGQQFNV